MWIARDNNEQLFAYVERPVRNEYDLVFDGGDCLELNSSEFPEVTWENSPIEIKTISNNVTDIDWEQRRYEIAKAALVGGLASPVVEGIDPNPSMQQVVQWAVKFADVLIEELKK